MGYSEGPGVESPLGGDLVTVLCHAGSQSPMVAHYPESSSTTGGEAVDLAAMAGLSLDPWQAFVLEHSLAEQVDGRWAAFEVGLVVPRQNGKGAIGEARALAGLFLLGERLIVWSAHQFDTSLEAFRRLLFLIEETPELSRRVKRVSRAHGEEGIELTSGQRVRFRTRTKGGGRGFTGDCLILDEAMILPEAAHGALLPTLSARPNPQVWYMGSAVDQNIHLDGLVFARVRERGHAGGDGRLAYFEWSFDPRPDGEGPVSPEMVGPDMAADEAAWRAANPSLGVRISAEHVENERRSMDPRTFAVERLGVGDWPDTDPAASSVIPLDRWLELVDGDSSIDGRVAFAYDVSPDRSTAAICAAGLREDGLVHVEVVDHRRGTGWLVERLRELRERHETAGVWCDGKGPAATLADDVSAGQTSAADYVAACGELFDRVDQGTLRHLGTPELEAALRGARKRSLVDAWVWSRSSSSVDITPLVAATLAVRAAVSGRHQSPYEHRGLVTF